MPQTVERVSVQQMEASSKRKLNSRSNDKNEEGTLQTLICKRKCATRKFKNSYNETNIHNEKILANKEIPEKKNGKDALRNASQEKTLCFLQESRLLNGGKGNQQQKKKNDKEISNPDVHGDWILNSETSLTALSRGTKYKTGSDLKKKKKHLQSENSGIFHCNKSLSSADKDFANVISQKKKQHKNSFSTSNKQAVTQKHKDGITQGEKRVQQQLGVHQGNDSMSKKQNVKHLPEVPVSTHDKFQGKGRKRELPFLENSSACDFKELCSGSLAENDHSCLDYGSSRKKKSKKNCESSLDCVMNTPNGKTQSLSLPIIPSAMDKKVFLKSESPKNGMSDFLKLPQKQLRGLEGREDTPERLNRTVFVGNLPLSFNRKLLHVLFQSFGEIESVRIRSAVPAKSSLPKKVAVIRKQFHCKSNSFNGYVVFKNVGDVEKALTLNKTVVQGHHIRVDRFKANIDYDGKRSVFVGNLPYDVTTDSLWSVFGECGSIEAVRIVRDPETGLGKGFGFVLFEECDSVERALLLNETQVNGRSVRVKPVEKGNRLKQKRPVQGHRTNLKMEKKHFLTSQASAGRKKKKKTGIQKKKRIMSILSV